MIGLGYLRPVVVFAALCTGGSAWADGINITGEVAMGLTGGSDQTGGSAVRLITDLELQMRLSRTTDNGLTFALELDIDDLELEAGTRGRGIPRRR